MFLVRLKRFESGVGLQSRQEKKDEVVGHAGEVSLNWLTDRSVAPHFVLVQLLFEYVEDLLDAASQQVEESYEARRKIHCGRQEDKELACFRIAVNDVV